MRYRPEVDGLRALAVVPVVLFHSGLGGISGGFVGVDVFFVISGFLITSILLEDARRGRISLLVFYERRARRILPALFAVMVAALAASVIWLPPDPLAQLAKSELAVLAFVSNVFFYLDTNYFAAAAEEKPMLHTWSLAVEEQFYVFFPLLLALMLRLQLRPRSRLAVLGVIAALSLAAAHLMSWRQGAANFFLIPTRAWELMAGAMLALWPQAERVGARPLDSVMAYAGLALLTYANTAFGRHTPYPGLPTLVPVVATVLLIRFAIPGTRVFRLLSAKPMVSIGLASYSLYLWHQPVLALLRAKSIGTPSVQAVLSALVICSVLAVISYRWVEQPFRDRKRYDARSIAVWSTVGAAFIACSCAAVLWGNGWPGRFEGPDYRTTMLSSPTRERCHTEGTNYLPPTKACRTLDTEPTWAVFGDSHTVELAEMLGRRLAPRGESVLRLSFSGCPPAWGYEARAQGCTAWTRDAINWLTSTKSIHTVVVGYRHSAYLYGDQRASYPIPPKATPTHLADVVASEHHPDQARSLYWQSFAALIAELQSAGKKVVVIYPVPELPDDVQKVLSPRSIFSTDTMVDPDRATTRSYFQSRHSAAIAELDRLPWGPALLKVRPDEALCDLEQCRAALEGKALYFDDDHLSLAGADLVAGQIPLADPPVSESKP